MVRTPKLFRRRTESTLDSGDQCEAAKDKVQRSISHPSTLQVPRPAQSLVDPTRPAHSGVDPTRPAHSGVDPTRSAQSLVDPTRPAHSGLDSTSQHELSLKHDVGHPQNGVSGHCVVVNGNDRFLGNHPVSQRLDHPGIMKKSEAKLPGLKPGLKKPVAKSPSLPKRQLSPDSGVGRSRSGGNTLQLPDDAIPQVISKSLDDLDKDRDDDSGTKENGSGGSDILDDIDGGCSEVPDSDAARTRLAITHFQDKISKTMEQIKVEQATKEANVNEYLKLAGEADKQQLQRIKQVFEKKNQKSTVNLSHLQKKLEKYNKSLHDVETYGAHKQARDKLKDMGQGLKGVGANIVDGLTGFSGGVVGNIKGAKETIVSKPREFAHLIKNKFGSADNITSLKTSDDAQTEEGDKSQGGGTLPARELQGQGGKSDDTGQATSFKYNSEEDNSSITSGSGFGAHSSPHSNSQNASQQIMVPQVALDTLVSELTEVRENNAKLQESLQRVLEEFEVYKMSAQQDVCSLKNVMDEDKFKMERIEEQMNDITELNQHEVNNLKQDIGSMEEKIEYRLDERTSDIQEQLESCQTRVTKMEMQQQQQQLISMEMVENVTFRTILTKLINVVLALVAVILVFVSTTASLVSPFLTTRARILSTAVVVAGFIISWNNWEHIWDLFFQFVEYIRYLLPKR